MDIFCNSWTYFLDLPGIEEHDIYIVQQEIKNIYSLSLINASVAVLIGCIDMSFPKA